MTPQRTIRLKQRWLLLGLLIVMFTAGTARSQAAAQIENCCTWGSCFLASSPFCFSDSDCYSAFKQCQVGLMTLV
jgi:hypothetical protein